MMDERVNEDERYEKLDRIWSKLKEVDRMILESYYVDGCRMEEIAKRIGYKNGVVKDVNLQTNASHIP